MLCAERDLARIRFGAETLTNVINTTFLVHFFVSLNCTTIQNSKTDFNSISTQIELVFVTQIISLEGLPEVNFMIITRFIEYFDENRTSSDYARRISRHNLVYCGCVHICESFASSPTRISCSSLSLSGRLRKALAATSKILKS